MMGEISFSAVQGVAEELAGMIAPGSAYDSWPLAIQKEWLAKKIWAIISGDAPTAIHPNVAPRDAVNHPQHYGGDTTYEAIKVIEAWELGFHLGNTVKYIRRAGYKGSILENLKKAHWYLDREIERLEKGS
jgi:uncharacterized protein DUF3310